MGLRSAPARNVAPSVHDVDLDLVAHVERTLATYLDTGHAAAEELDAQFAGTVRALREFVLSGGKRIRPTFAWWGWRGALQGEDEAAAQLSPALSVISALELVQANALVHDDLIDDSAVRRGAPTVHTTFGQLHHEQDWSGDPKRFGVAAAVLIGDLALAWADDMLLGSGLDADALRRVIAPWHAMRTEMLAGQYLDVTSQARVDESTETAIRIDQLKTAAYTVQRPLQIGGAMAGASGELLAAYRGFGADLGVAFQLRDDLLGVFGDPAVTGKPAGDDLREGKRTLLLALGLLAAEQQNRHADAEALRDGVGRVDLNQSQVAELSALLVDLGAVASVERRISELTSSAMRTLEAAPVREPAATRLAELAISVTEREH